MGDVIQFLPRPNPSRFAQSYLEVRKELASLVPFAKTGGPIEDHNDYAPSEWRAPEQDPA